MWNINISLWEVKKAAGNRKAAGPDGVMAEHIKCGGVVLLIHLSVLFQAMVRHSFIPEQFIESIIGQKWACVRFRQLQRNFLVLCGLN